MNLDMDNLTISPDDKGPNVTHPADPYADVNEFVDKYVTLFIFFIGFPGNIFCFIIWMQKQMRHSSGVYLAALAFTDLIFLCLLVVFELQQAWGIETINFHVWCSIFPVLHLVAQYLSPLLVLAFTTERYISICHPFKREKYCTIRRAKLVIAGLVVLTFAFGSVHGYFYEMQFDPSTNTTSCGLRASVREGGTKSVFSIYSTVIDMLCFLVGNVAVLVLNVFVIFEMRRLSKVEQTQLKGNSSQKKSATTVMLLSVSFYQILTTMPVSVAYALYMEYDFDETSPDLDMNKALMRYYAYNHVLTFIKEYGTTHYAFNIFIYLITGKMFREQLKNLLRGRVGRRSLNSEYSSLRSSVRATSIKASNTNWLHVNGNGQKASEPETNVNAGETLL